MEKQLERVMDELVSKPGVFGCMFSDHQGLCLGVKGNASIESSGIVAAIAKEANKLETRSPPPTIVLESDNKACIIQNFGTISGTIYKHLQ